MQKALKAKNRPLDYDRVQMIISGKLVFDHSQIRNTEDELIVSTIENSWYMLSRSRGRLLADVQSPAELSEKDQNRLVELEEAMLRLIEQASQTGLLKG